MTRLKRKASHRCLFLGALLIVLLSGCADPEKEALTPNNEPLPPGEWIETSPDPSPSARILHAMAYDTDRKQVILFGGEDESGVLNDTWIYDTTLNTWTALDQTEGPPLGGCTSIQATPVMVYDQQNHQAILFGWPDVSCSKAETWAYNPASQTWALLNNGNSSPALRSLTAMVYVQDTQQAILFGGETEDGLNDETWVFDNDTWTERTPNSSPPPRIKHAMAYDEINQQVILFGGETDSDEKNGETWAYDVDNNLWMQLSPTDPPDGRIGHTMVYDTINERIMMFGGFAPDSPVPTGETWVFDYPTNQWSKLSPSPTPGYLFLHAMVYDSDNQQAILFGGAKQGCGSPGCTDIDPNNYLDDTWIYLPDQ